MKNEVLKKKKPLSSFKSLMQEWDFIKNKVDPDKLTHGSAKKRRSR